MEHIWSELYQAAVIQYVEYNYNKTQDVIPER